MKPPRPGIILVRSRPTVPEFTPSDLTAWYEQKHVPELLAVSGAHITSAARYQLLDQTLPGQDAQGGEHKRGREKTQGYEHTVDQALPYLAVYRLRDMGWLHEDGCGFWEVDLRVDVDSGQGKERKSVFEVAEFETGFWEEVAGGLEIQSGDGTRDGGDEVLAEGLMLVLLGAEGGHGGEDPETMLRNSVPMLVGVGRVRSTLFRVDESRLCPPSVRGKQEAGLQPSEKRYLCLVSWSQCPR